jgi:hypothetical protein
MKRSIVTKPTKPTKPNRPKNPRKVKINFGPLTKYLKRVPAVNPNIGTGDGVRGLWWCKFTIDIEHSLAWHVVQELGHVLNYVSLEERLPTDFKPVSPPPSGNGGPKEFLSWVIESSDPTFTPALCAEWLEGRLPRPVEDADQWKTDQDQ